MHSKTEPAAANTTGSIVLYHGSPNESIVPTYGKGEDRHDYGKGFYLTEYKELAKEWAVCSPAENNGYVHEFTLDLKDLKVFDFSNKSVLHWLAELMRQRDADNSKRYRLLSRKFIEKYAFDLESYDVIRGWRANASYFYIAKAFVRDEVDIDILEPLLSLGELGIQYCLKSEKAFTHLTERIEGLEIVNFNEYNAKYNERDARARSRMRELIDSDQNKLKNVFSSLV